MEKRFYVGAPHLVNDPHDHLKKTVEQAIKEAKEKCEDTGETQIVVKIVAVIEKAKQPVKVRMLSR